MNGGNLKKRKLFPLFFFAQLFPRDKQSSFPVRLRRRLLATRFSRTTNFLRETIKNFEMKALINKYANIEQVQKVIIRSSRASIGVDEPGLASLPISGPRAACISCEDLIFPRVPRPSIYFKVAMRARVPEPGKGYLPCNTWPGYFCMSFSSLGRAFPYFSTSTGSDEYIMEVSFLKIPSIVQLSTLQTSVTCTTRHARLQSNIEHGERERDSANLNISCASCALLAHLVLSA